ncbi:MAG: hypothetical protein AB1297_02620, partial [bacterium]
AKWGGVGNKDGEFMVPTNIAIDLSGYVYVVDVGNYRIQKFTQNGSFTGKWGEYGTSNGQFDSPTGIAIDPSSYIYVADYGNHRIQKFTKDGGFITKWGEYGTSNGQFNSPCGVAIDSSSYVYVADAKNDRIQKFTLDGSFKVKWGSYGSLDGQFNRPTGIAIDSFSYIYVIDGWNHRIQKFIKRTAASYLKKEIPVYPNPFRFYSPYNHTKIKFGHPSEEEKKLTKEATIRIYNIAGELLKTIMVNPSDGGYKEWDVRNEAFEPLASGIYIYLITNPAGEKITGKIGIIK